MNYTEEDKKRIFGRCTKVSGLDPKIWRLDAAGAIICYTSYGREDEFFGWEIDHIYPQSRLEELNVPKELIHDERNLRALNWNNNLSKGDEYPKYEATITSLDNGESNTKGSWSKTINKRKQEQLKELFKDYDLERI